ncbi:MAG: type II secretion system protein GspG [Candidatus Omnitrophica bacterium]|nr:type II secretion system protein GspG [Candidatus Omnitrophota bacterium]MBU1048348.1 type II secretion system protein GspG [Candidatus Omnitrophota bacterium]MBU1631194.1 type II secretion system protein GspG [Candidatus Omnitrophota bacterium]MBU1767757.1 type II secretion system protein GspG [Candidatus Omnitrophota bacterium]MBU1889670.1 type II secretion system protein GspG [Candidatus Omnitrophota bacterium]
MNKLEIPDSRFQIQDCNKESSIFNFQSSISKGFTLMELMVVIAIIVLLAGIMTPNVARRLERAKMTRAEADIAAIENAIAMYENDTGRYPEDTHPTAPAWESIQVLAWRLTARDKDGLVGSDEDLIRNDPNWHGPYIKGVENDSWDTGYVYMKNENPSTPTQGTDYPLDNTGGVGTPPDNLGYYIYSTGKNKDTGDATKAADDVNNWDVKKLWREEY